MLAGLATLSTLTIGAASRAVQIGADEHFEVEKGLLWTRGLSLYHRVWNDQPPLYTVLIGLCFKTFGATIGKARVLAVVFGLSLWAACVASVKRRCGMLVALLAMFLLLAAPGVLKLSLSVMLEVPAIGTALWALWPMLRWQDRRSWRWLALSGALLGVALQIELTAAIAAPALLVVLLLAAGAADKSARLKNAMRALMIWGGSVIGVYLLLASQLGHVPLHVLWASHFSDAMLKTALGTPVMPFWPVLWFDHREALSATGMALLLLAYQRHWRQLAFPLVWLFTVVLIHAWYRPWWAYYYLHFAVPLAWLSAYGIAELFQLAGVKVTDKSLPGSLQSYACTAAATLLLSLGIAYGGERLISEVQRIQQLPRVEESRLVANMRQYAVGTRWVYTRETIYPFHAGLLVVPELAVLPAKRFWSGQITDEQIWATVRRYQSEQLLLEGNRLPPDISGFVEAGYTPVCRERGLVLYVAKTLTAGRNTNGHGEP